MVFVLLSAGEALVPRRNRAVARRWRWPAAVEANTNFGFTFPWWDYLCGTYRTQPAAGHEAMTVGLTCFRDRKYLRPDKTLLQPLFDDHAPRDMTDRRAA